MGVLIIDGGAVVAAGSLIRHARRDAVGGSLGPARLWFTLGYGIANEVYKPRIDPPYLRSRICRR